jgi:23S rRNA (pseudouridine1915-N3)-methyltransferase
MKLRLVAVDKLREPYVAAAAADFRARLRRYEPVDEIEVAASRGTDPERAMREEGERILKTLQPGDVLWLLERDGTQLSSLELAERLQSLGEFRASEGLLARADFRWSLSRLTFLHEWARALVLEQLYRAAKIARNEPYHH